MHWPDFDAKVGLILIFFPFESFKFTIDNQTLIRVYVGTSLESLDGYEVTEIQGAFTLQKKLGPDPSKKWYGLVTL